MKIKLNISPETAGHIIDDLAYLDRLAEKGKDEKLDPDTVEVLRQIVRLAREKVADRGEEANNFTEVFYGRTEPGFTSSELQNALVH